MSNNILLVLDLNKTLILRKSHNNVIKRKYFKEFKEFCFSVSDVSIYSSMLEKNMELNRIFTDEEIKKLIFVWDRKKTIIDKDGYNSWDSIKSLDIIREEYPNYEKIIIIDDSESKLRFVSKDNKIIIQPFVKEDESEEVLKELINEIEKRIKF